MSLPLPPETDDPRPRQLNEWYGAGVMIGMGVWDGAEDNARLAQKPCRDQYVAGMRYGRRIKAYKPKIPTIDLSEVPE